ncbi:MAG TPA: DUF4139 domain-containing protein, partial [Terriglobia bacterium]|nr:DUF4139 domain-containing protein [Terriglobia bacterium]
KVKGSQELHIDFTTGQLNDALASLTATDLGDGHITSIRFNSIAPLSERLRALHLPLNRQTTRQQFLSALRGTQVEIQNGTTRVTGKLLSVENESKTVGRDQARETVLVVSVITSAGDLRSFQLGPDVSVRMADGELRGDVAQYLKLIGSERAEDVRRMTITDDGTGDRTVRVSYISEVPVWKSTYRILLPSDAKEKPLIQGWAVVDNTLGEDWKNVQLALVSGAPQSFVQNLSTPSYVRRPVVPLPHSALLTPQTHEGALMPMAKKPMGYGSGVGTAGGVPGGQVSGVLGGVIGGVTAGPPAAAPNVRTRVEVTGGGGGSRAPLESMADILSRVEPQATGRQLSELFEYDIKNKVTIGRNQSALVPILQAKLDAEKVTLWNAGEPVPLRALWLTNSSGLALDAGAFNVVDDGTFAGEGLFDTISAGQKRLVSYAADPAIQVSTKESAPPEQVTRIRIAKGLMITTRELRQTETYRVSDSDTKPRTVIIEHPVREDWKLASGLKPDETTPSYYRFKVDVNPKESAKLVVDEIHPLVSQMDLASMTDNEVELLARQKRLTPEMEVAFRKILERKNAVAALDSEIQARQREVTTISADQTRIRENMKALKGGTEEKQLLGRYVRELNSQEDHLSSLRSQLADLNAKRKQAAAELDQAIQGITLNVTF